MSGRFERLIESVLLEPGGREAARLLVAFRYLLLFVNSAFLGVYALIWDLAFHLVAVLIGINVLLLLWTAALGITLRVGSARALRAVMAGSFLFDFSVEVVALMSSGLAQSTLVVIPLLTLMTVALLLDRRSTLLCAGYFMVAYPVGALLVKSGTWGFFLWARAPWGAPSPVPDIGFILVQEAYFAIVLTAFLFLVAQLRRLYQRFSQNLEAASARIASEVHERQLEKLHAENALLQRERDYRLLADHVTDLVALCNERLEYTFVSPSAESVLGRSPSELVGTPIRSLVHADDWPSVERMLAAHRKGTASTRELVVEYRANHKEGRWVWLETRGRTMPDGVSVLSSRDITERRSLEEKMRHSQKLESLGLLAGGVAHDFNNILLGILGSAELAAMEQPAGSPLRESLRTIVGAAQRAAGLCKQMLAYAGKGNIALAPLSLNQVVEDIPALLKVALPRNATLSVRLDQHLPLIEGDLAQIQQVAMNLIINAAEALPEPGGTVIVESGVVDMDKLSRGGPEHELEWSADKPAGKYVHLTVSDDGCGMDRQTLDRMFDPFFSTKFAGRGLGLSAVAGIVNGHRGAIRVHSQPGRGTRVMVAFPLRDLPDAIRRRAPSGEAALAWRGTGTVLLIDDETAIVDVVGQMLTRLGFEVLSAVGGAEGVALFQRRAADIALVICDFAMPQMDGIEAFQAVKSTRPEVKFIMTSGLSETEMRKRLSPCGVDCFLQKPFSFKQLASTVQSVCEPD